jgi:hypothetical protein
MNTKQSQETDNKATTNLKILSPVTNVNLYTYSYFVCSKINDLTDVSLIFKQNKLCVSSSRASIPTERPPFVGEVGVNFRG